MTDPSDYDEWRAETDKLIRQMRVTEVALAVAITFWVVSFLVFLFTAVRA